MIREWIKRVLNRSIKTTVSEEKLEDMIVPMTHVPDEFRRKLDAERVEKRLQSMEDKT